MGLVGTIVVDGNSSGRPRVILELPGGQQIVVPPERAREIGVSLIEAATAARLGASICSVLVAGGRTRDEAEAVVEQAELDAALAAD